jgi:hypothetical protein
MEVLVGWMLRREGRDTLDDGHGRCHPFPAEERLGVEHFCVSVIITGTSLKRIPTRFRFKRADGE